MRVRTGRFRNSFISICQRLNAETSAPTVARQQRDTTGIALVGENPLKRFRGNVARRFEPKSVRAKGKV